VENIEIQNPGMENDKLLPSDNTTGKISLLLWKILKYKIRGWRMKTPGHEGLFHGLEEIK